MIDFDYPRRMLEKHIIGIADDIPLPILLENVPASAQINEVRKARSGDWCALTVRGGTGVQLTISPKPWHRYPVNAIIQIFIPPNVGTSRALSHAQRFADGINATRIKYAEIRTPYESARQMQAEWFMINLTIPTIFDLKEGELELPD